MYMMDFMVHSASARVVGEKRMQVFIDKLREQEKSKESVEFIGQVLVSLVCQITSISLTRR